MPFQSVIVFEIIHEPVDVISSAPVMAMVTARHNLLVRVTHWINVLVFLSAAVSGAAILLAHPRFYWGETGAFGSPALLELPLPLNLDQSGWGRSLHFLSAWVCVLNGFVYVLAGFISHRFGKDRYTTPHRFTYLAVVFVLFPLMIATGLAMSPAVMSIAPFIVQTFGGHQSARTIHFFVTNVLVVFVVGHVVMVYMAGFSSRMRGMITGREVGVKESL
jgi:thiosulfate reductase cytochrome b subunit